MIIAFISSMIIARLLTPAEIGVYSVASALVAIVHQIRIFGVGNYLVQEPELTHDRIRSAFGLLLLISWVLAAAVFGASFAAARLYDNPGVGSVMRVFALNFVLAPFGGIAMTLLLREMRFGARAVYELASAIVLAVTTVSLAYLGFSYMSLAWGSLAGLVTGMVIANFYRPRGLPWLPSFRELRHVAAFGGPSAAADLVASLRLNTAELIVGRALGFDAVAYLSRASSLTGHFYRLIGSVGVKVAGPYFAQERRAGGDLRGAYLAGVAYLSGIGWPFFAVLAILAEPVVRLLFGSQWDNSIPLVRVACLAGAIGLPFWMVNTFANAMGKPVVIMRIELVALACTVGLVLIGAAGGLLAVAWGLCGVALLIAWRNARALRELVGITVSDLAASLYQAIGITAVTILATLPTVLFAPPHLGDAIRVASGGASAGAGWLVACFWLKHPLRDEIVKAVTAIGVQFAQRR